MTTRTLTHPGRGPLELHVRCVAANVEVTFGDVDQPRVFVLTTATSGPAHDAVEAAQMHRNGNRLDVELRDQHNAVNGTVISGSFSGTIVQVGGRTFTNGVEVKPGPETAPIRIQAHLPGGSALEVRTTSGDLYARGPAGPVRTETVSGDVRIESAGTVIAHSTSGRIRIQSAISVQAHNISGDIAIGSVGAVSAETVSGDLRIDDTDGYADVHSVSGDITAHYSGPMRPKAHSMSGRVDVRPSAAYARPF